MPFVRSRARSLTEVGTDDRGAVMLVGIAMALFLVGAMWTVAGLADAMVYRDRLQEAADHAAFTSAAVHARGMNLVSALNLILFAASALHVLMGFVTVLANAAALIPFPPVAVPARALATGAFRVWDVYYRFMRPVQKGVGTSSKVVAFAYPYLGAAAAVGVGAEYGEATFTFGPSMVPGPAINGLVNATGLNRQLASRLPPVGAVPGARTTTMSPITSRTGAPVVADERLALPVKEEANGFSCMIVAKYTLESLLKIDFVRQAYDFSILGFHPVRMVLNGIFGSVAQKVRDVFCNDGTFIDLPESLRKLLGKLNGQTEPVDNPQRADASGGWARGLLPPFGIVTMDPFWGEMGPKVMWDGAANGSDWMQVWAWALGGKDVDRAKRRVLLAQKSFAGADETVDYPAFDAQAEFYFDCRGRWADFDCNDGLDTRATYGMRWRARLVRVRPANLIEIVGGSALNAALNPSVLNYVRGRQNNSRGVADLEARLGTRGPGLVRGQLGGANGAQGRLGREAAEVRGMLRGVLRPGTDSFH